MPVFVPNCMWYLGDHVGTSRGQQPFAVRAAGQSLTNDRHFPFQIFTHCSFWKEKDTERGRERERTMQALSLSSLPSLEADLETSAKSTCPAHGAETHLRHTFDECVSLLGYDTKWMSCAHWEYPDVQSAAPSQRMRIGCIWCPKHTFQYLTLSWICHHTQKGNCSLLTGVVSCLLCLQIVIYWPAVCWSCSFLTTF